MTTTETAITFDEAIKFYFEHLVKSYEAFMPPKDEISANMCADFANGLDTTKGQKYTKIVSGRNGGGRSVHSFVDGQGNIWKPAGWKGPKLNFIRGNIFKPESYVGHSWAGL